MGGVYFVIALIGAIYWAFRIRSEKKDDAKWESEYIRTSEAEKGQRESFEKQVCDRALELKMKTLVSGCNFGDYNELLDVQNELKSTWMKYTGEEIDWRVSNKIKQMVLLANRGKIPVYAAAFGVTAENAFTNEQSAQYFKNLYVVQRVLIDHGIDYKLYLERTVDSRKQLAPWNGESAMVPCGDPLWVRARWEPSLLDYEKKSITSWPYKS